MPLGFVGAQSLPGFCSSIFGRVRASATFVVAGREKARAHSGEMDQSLAFSESDGTTIKRAYRVRLSPNSTQAHLIRRLFGARRWVYNHALDAQVAAMRSGGTTGLCAMSAWLTNQRRSPETSWLSELPREPLQQTLRDLDRAFLGFRAGTTRRPRRKPYGCVRSARFTLDQRRHQVDRVLGCVDLPRIGRLRFRMSEPLLGRLRSVTEIGRAHV